MHPNGITSRVCVVGAALLVLTGCGDTGPTPGGGVTSTGTTMGPAALSVVEVVEGVRFYPACGNEVVEVDGVTWYQLLREEMDGLDRTHVPDASAAGLPAGMAEGVPAALRAVPAPGLGDDVGTLWVFSDGLAYWEADSGELRTWLTQEERTYGWVC